MSETDQLIGSLEGRARRREDRRAFFTAALGAAAVGAGAFAFASPAAAQAASDADLLNFALNLEYLEANYYHFAAFGTAIPTDVQGTSPGAITGGAKVNFTDPLVSQYAREIAADELEHVRFLRSVLGLAAVAQPAINISGAANGAFSAAAQAAGLVPSGAAFDPYASDEAFLLGAYIFEDVGVTAYKGATPLIANKTLL